MTVITDIASDLALIDGLETVTVTLKRVAGDTSVSIASAQREAISKAAPSYAGVMLQGGETVWHIPDNLLNPSANGRVLNVNDEITHGSTVYVVIGARLEVLGTVWAAVCNTRL